MMGISIPLRRLAIVMAIAVVALTAAGIAAEYSRHFLGSKSLLIALFSLTEEKNVPTWWSSALLLACSGVLCAIAATKPRADGQFRALWILLAAIFCYLSIDEFVELHEWLTFAPVLSELRGSLYYGWVVPATFAVLVFAVGYLRFLFHLPKSTRIKVALAGALYVGGALGVEFLLGVWTETHGEDDFGWKMIGLVEESMEIMGSSLFLYALLEYLGKTVPELGVTIRSGRD